MTPGLPPVRIKWPSPLCAEPWLVLREGFVGTLKRFMPWILERLEKPRDEREERRATWQLYRLAQICHTAFLYIQTLVEDALHWARVLAERDELVASGLRMVKSITIVPSYFGFLPVPDGAQPWTDLEPPAVLWRNSIVLSASSLAYFIARGWRLGVKPSSMVRIILLHEMLHLALGHEERIARLLDVLSTRYKLSLTDRGGGRALRVAVTAADYVVNKLIVERLGPQAEEVIRALGGVHDSHLDSVFRRAPPEARVDGYPWVLEELSVRMAEAIIGGRDVEYDACLASLLMSFNPVFRGSKVKLNVEVCDEGELGEDEDWVVDGDRVKPSYIDVGVEAAAKAFMDTLRGVGGGGGAKRGERYKRVELDSAVVEQLRELLETLARGSERWRKTGYRRSPRPSRRTGLAPSMIRDAIVGHTPIIYVALDTSGSVYDRELEAVATLLYETGRKLGLRRFRLLLWHTRVYYDGILRPRSVPDLLARYAESGGTDPNSIARHLEARGEPRPGSLLVIGSDCIFLDDDAERFAAWAEAISRERGVAIAVMDYTGRLGMHRCTAFANRIGAVYLPL